MHIHVLCINSWHEGAALSQLSQFHRLMGDAFHLQCVKPWFFSTSAALVQDVSFASLARSPDSKAHHGSRWCTRDYCIASAQHLQDWQCTRLLKEEHDKYTRIPLAFGGISVTCSYSMKFWLKKCCWRSKYLEHMWVSLCVNIFVWHLDWHAKAVLDVPDHLRAVPGGVLCESTAAAVIFGLVCDAVAAWFLLDRYAVVHV